MTARRLKMRVKVRREYLLEELEHKTEIRELRKKYNELLEEPNRKSNELVVDQGEK